MKGIGPKYPHPLGSCTLTRKGYLRIKTRGKYRDWFLHRAVWTEVAGRPIPEGFVIHHQNNVKQDCRPENLICMPSELNPAPELRHPYTGRYLSVSEYCAVMGIDPEVPF
jgi:hypothetical protein